MFIYLILDIVVVILSFFIINRRNALSFYHPGTLLLFYHIVNNTFRFWALTNGADFAYKYDKSIVGATEEELIRGMFWLDMSLLVSAVAISFAELMPTAKTELKERPLNNNILIGVLIFTIPLGLYGAATQLYIPAVENNIQNIGTSEESAATTYLSMIQTWFGLSCLILIYFKGFKPQFVIPLLVYLFVIALQGYARFRLVLPCIFLATTYLYYYNLKWPKKSQLILLAFLALLFYPLKEVGKVVRDGGDISDVANVVVKNFESTQSGNADDQSFLDQYAMTLTEIDRSEKIYYGGTVSPVLVMLVPRSWWPSKPGLNEWQKDISSNYRPFTTIGSIATIYGESYANFRYLGILFVPALLFFVITRWYYRILNKKLLDMDKFFYALMFCCMIQVLRDGLLSLLIFPVLNNMPLFLVFILHKIFVRPVKTDTEDGTAGDSPPGSLQVSH
jgi:oligosaccharide repeat unit polymerase